MNNFGKNLYFLRKQKGLRQAQIKDLLGFSRTTWSNYENAISEPTIEGLIKISIFFGISLEKLILSNLADSQERQFEKSNENETIKSQSYLLHEEFPFVVNETGLSHIMKELHKLKEEIDLLKGSQRKKRNK